MPDSTMYQLYMNGKIANKSNTDLPLKYNETDEWITDVTPVKSAYKSFNNLEPEFTNWAFTKDSKEDFFGTLDYIFLSNHWKVKSVKKLPNKTEIKGPFPMESEPSDHLLISATIDLE